MIINDHIVMFILYEHKMNTHVFKKEKNQNFFAVFCNNKSMKQMNNVENVSVF